MKKRSKALQKQFLTDTKLTPEQTMEFLENYKKMLFSIDQDRGSQAISIRIPKSLLESFKLVCQSKGIAYQTQMNHLIRDFLIKN